MTDYLENLDPNNLANKIRDLESRLKQLENRGLVFDSLDEVTDDMGVQTSGEFRTGEGEPGDGFSGMRMSYPPMQYNNEEWNLVGVNNDVLQFGGNSANGKFYGGGGAVVVDENGITIETTTDDDFTEINALTFTDGAMNIHGLYSRQNVSGFGNFLELRSQCKATFNSNLTIVASHFTGEGTFSQLTLGAVEIAVPFEAGPHILLFKDDTQGFIGTDGDLHFEQQAGTILDDKGLCGFREEFVASCDQEYGDICFINGSGEAQIADADKSAAEGVLVANVEPGSTPAAGQVWYAHHGSLLRNTAWNWTVGAPIYLSSAGSSTNTMTETKPTGVGIKVIRIGVAIDPNTIYFEPDVLQSATSSMGNVFLTSSGMYPTTTDGCSANTKAESAANKLNIYMLDFDDTTEENAQAAFAMPSDWDAGNVTFKFHWTADSTSTNSVVWGVKGRAIGNDETIDQTFGTEKMKADANTATALQLHISEATDAMTFAGSPVAGDFVVINIARKVDEGADTLAGDARLLGVTMYFGRI